MVSLKNRGVKQVLLFASDGLEDMRDAVKHQFPQSEHQQCWVHLSRTVARYIRQKDRKKVLGDLKSVYRADNAENSEKELTSFLGKYKKTYPRFAGIFKRAEQSQSQFFKFLEAIRKSIYTTNLIERSNKGLKHKSKSRCSSRMKTLLSGLSAATTASSIVVKQSAPIGASNWPLLRSYSCLKIRLNL